MPSGIPKSGIYKREMTSARKAQLAKLHSMPRTIAQRKASSILARKMVECLSENWKNGSYAHIDYSSMYKERWKNGVFKNRPNHLSEEAKAKMSIARRSRDKSFDERHSVVMRKYWLNGVMKSKTAFYGTHMTILHNNTILNFKSNLEIEAYCAFILDPYISFIEYEPFRIPYFCSGKTSSYTPDFLITHTDGSKEIVEVKPEFLIIHPETQLKKSAAVQFLSSRNMSYRFLTEKELRA